VSLSSALPKWKPSSYLRWVLLLRLPVAGEWFHVYSRVGWQLKLVESCNTFALCTGRIVITWPKLFSRWKVNMKSLMKRQRSAWLWLNHYNASLIVTNSFLERMLFLPYSVYGRGLKHVACFDTVRLFIFFLIIWTTLKDLMPYYLNST